LNQTNARNLPLMDEVFGGAAPAAVTSDIAGPDLLGLRVAGVLLHGSRPGLGAVAVGGGARSPIAPRGCAWAGRPESGKVRVLAFAGRGVVLLRL